VRGRLLALAAALVWIAPVDAQTPPASGSRIVETARLDPTQGINFASGVWPDRVYIGQQRSGSSSARRCAPGSDAIRSLSRPTSGR
jgi:hypothetical protein